MCKVVGTVRIMVRAAFGLPGNEFIVNWKQWTFCYLFVLGCLILLKGR